MLRMAQHTVGFLRNPHPGYSISSRRGFWTLFCCHHGLVVLPTTCPKAMGRKCFSARDPHSL